jgi:hypothetical protein
MRSIVSIRTAGTRESGCYTFKIVALYLHISTFEQC